MKKVLYVLSTILMLTVLLSFASCKKDDDVTDSTNSPDSSIDTSQSENQEPQEPISEYELIYRSYGNGTCDVTGIWVSPGSRDVTITVPAISPDGERVISCDIRCNPIPKIIKKDVFESEICEPILAAIENGALGGVADGKAEKNFYYREFMSFFSLYDINDSDRSQEVIDMILQAYPITKETAIYVFASNASSAEILDFSRYISEYTNFFESDSYQESISISKDYQNTFCMYDVVTKVVFEDGIQTICSAAGHRNVTELVLPDSISIEKDAFLGYDNLIEIENGVSYIDKWVIDCNTDVTNVSLRANTIGIAEDAFAGCNSLTSIEIPNGVTTIGKRAFSDCNSLTSIEIPNSVTTIGENAFAWCNNLKQVENGVLYVGRWVINCDSDVTSVSLRQNTVGIAYGAFSDHNILTSIEIPNGVTTIGDRAFYGCKNLTSIEIPNSVTTIGDYAFCGCNSLTSIEIPNSVTSIGHFAFFNRGGLTSLMVEIGNSKYHSDGNCIIETESKTLVIGIHNSIIPSNGSVTVIGNAAFASCNSLTSIEIPNSVTSIGHLAFSGCENLTSIEIPNSVTTIGDEAFRGCKSLTSIEIPNSVTTIGDYAFSDCNSLTRIEIPNSVKSIGYDAFHWCSNLETIIYHGTEEEWNAINDSNNEYDCTVTFLG